MRGCDIVPEIGQILEVEGIKHLARVVAINFDRCEITIEFFPKGKQAPSKQKTVSNHLVCTLRPEKKNI